MAEVDTSIYGKLQQPNALGVAQQVQDYDTSVQQNKLVTMEAQGKRLLGQAVQQATGPDGNVDQAKLGEILKRPEYYPAAAAGAQLGLGLQQGQQAVTKSGMDISQAGYQNLGTMWGARASRSQGDLDPQTLRQDVLDLVARGGMDPKLALPILRSIPEDPKAARAFATGGFLQALGPAGMAGPAIATPGPGGETREQTRAQAVTQEMGGAPPAPGEVPATGIRTSPTLAQQQSLPRAGASATDQSTRLQTLVNDVPLRKGNLDNMLADAQEFVSGPASEELKTTISGINEIFGTHFNVDRVAAQERFDKLSNQIALQQSGDLGITDLTTQTAMGANPNSRLSNLGVEGVIAMLKGNEDAIATKGEQWHDYLDAGHTPDEFYRFSQDFNKNYDPRVFQTTYLDQASRKKMISALRPAEQKEFRRKFNYAVEHGWIPDPRQQ